MIPWKAVEVLIKVDPVSLQSIKQVLLHDCPLQGLPGLLVYQVTGARVDTEAQECHRVVVWVEEQVGMRAVEDKR